VLITLTINPGQTANSRLRTRNPGQDKPLLRQEKPLLPQDKPLPLLPLRPHRSDCFRGRMLEEEKKISEPVTHSKAVTVKVDGRPLKVRTLCTKRATPRPLYGTGLVNLRTSRRRYNDGKTNVPSVGQPTQVGETPPICFQAPQRTYRHRSEHTDSPEQNKHRSYRLFPRPRRPV